MEADDRRDAVGLETILQHRQQPLQVRQFSIHQDAQGLKRPRRRVQLGAGGALQREIPCRADDRRQLLRGGDRRFGASLDIKRSAADLAARELL